MKSFFIIFAFRFQGRHHCKRSVCWTAARSNCYVCQTQGNQFCGDFEVDVEKHPTGVFCREGGEMSVLLLSFSIAKR